MITEWLSFLHLGSLLLSNTQTHFKPEGEISNVVLFGDSFTDQSRSHSISRGIYPGKNYQQLYPPDAYAADGGIQWPWYLGLYGNYTIWNYAVGGAVCSEQVTPLFNVPDVAGRQRDWFVLDHIENAGTAQQRLLLDPASFVVVIFVGTNDVGAGANDRELSLVDLADCQLNSIREMHKLGARRFILNSMAPLHLAVMYSTPSGYRARPYMRDGPEWHKKMYNIVNTMNRILKNGVALLNIEWQANGSDAHVDFFDTYSLFQEMYHNPTKYFNGSIPANVTGFCGGCPEDERDSYLWWDHQHPSEQAGRNLAAEIHKKIMGRSVY